MAYQKLAKLFYRGTNHGTKSACETASLFWLEPDRPMACNGCKQSFCERQSTKRQIIKLDWMCCFGIFFSTKKYIFRGRIYTPVRGALCALEKPAIEAELLRLWLNYFFKVSIQPGDFLGILQVASLIWLSFLSIKKILITDKFIFKLLLNKSFPNFWKKLWSFYQDKSLGLKRIMVDCTKG